MKASVLKIAPQHLSMLCESGIDPDTVRDAGLFSLYCREEVRHLLDVAPPANTLPALVFPYHIPGLECPVLHRVRLGRAWKSSHGKALRYLGPRGKGFRLYFPPAMLRDVNGRRSSPALPLFITEGEKKALALDCAGFASIALPGVFCWRARPGSTELHPDFKHVSMNNREIFIAFDSDTSSNKAVYREQALLRKSLEVCLG